ncbi:DUF6036 family nucleotidyltransferase [Nocardia donostiensis]|uniref:DUF6036 family nucleotidyltransferase n=1 Tax=Nocardia donostiensis TaxID=1538463 RepID=UPI001589EE62|nr:DUF6036 family nucleotidyltransferase [Nocardia donostiensis]
MVVFGSQSILGSFDETVLPPEASRSLEVDIAPFSAFHDGVDPTTIADKLYVLDVWLGEGSAFEELTGTYVEGVARKTVVLPYGWENRLVKFSVSGGDKEDYGCVGYCLDPIDLCVAKSLAGREKDKEFVGALVAAKIVTATEIVGRIDAAGIDWPAGYIATSEEAEARARAWLSSINAG